MTSSRYVRRYDEHLAHHARALDQATGQAALLQYAPTYRSDLQGVEREGAIILLRGAAEDHRAALRPHIPPHVHIILGVPGSGDEYEVWNDRDLIFARPYHTDHLEDEEDEEAAR